MWVLAIFLITTIIISLILTLLFLKFKDSNPETISEIFSGIFSNSNNSNNSDNSSNSGNDGDNSTTTNNNSGIASAIPSTMTELQAAMDALTNYANNATGTTTTNAPEVATTDTVSKDKEDDKPTNRFDLIDLEE